MHDIVYLILNCCNNLWISVTSVIYSDTCIKIKIWCTILIVNIHSLCCLS